MTISQRNNVIKLLPKSGIADLKAKEQARTIEEGMKIARKVDGLRETYAKTEQDLEKYRIATLSAIGDEISKLNLQKELLSGDIRLMQSQYDALMPEIALKRAEVYHFEKSLKAWETKLEKREHESGLAELDVFEAKKKAESLLKLQEDNERISRNLLIQAEEKKQEAERTLHSARTKEDRAIKDQKDGEAAMNLREFSIQAKERELSNKEMELMGQQKELDKQKILVKDQRETVLRSIARIKANRLP